jgi:hypothetical protein
MRSQALVISAVLASLLGIFQCYVILFCWPYIGAYSPVPHWLLGIGLRGSTLHVVSGAFDFLLNVVLALPVALVLAHLRPAKLWLYVALALIAAIVWLNAGFAGSFSRAWIPPLIATPVAAWLVSFWRGRQSSNNSFKPNPLRSSKTPSSFSGGSA